MCCFSLSQTSVKSIRWLKRGPYTLQPCPFVSLLSPVAPLYRVRPLCSLSLPLSYALSLSYFVSLFWNEGQANVLFSILSSSPLFCSRESLNEVGHHLLGSGTGCWSEVFIWLNLVLKTFPSYKRLWKLKRIDLKVPLQKCHNFPLIYLTRRLGISTRNSLRFSEKEPQQSNRILTYCFISGDFPFSFAMISGFSTTALAYYKYFTQFCWLIPMLSFAYHPCYIWSQENTRLLLLLLLQTLWYFLSHLNTTYCQEI